MTTASSPAREAFARIARILEKLPDDGERRRVIRAFAILLDMAEPSAKGGAE